MYNLKQTKSYFSILTLSAFLGFIMQSCALKPMVWHPSEKPKPDGVLAENELLQSTKWIDLKGWYGPEDIAVDKKGNIYCGVHVSEKNFSNGSILKIDIQGNVNVFCKTESWVTGLHFDRHENLIACDQKRGLISVNQKGEITELVHRDEYGKEILIPNDVDIANDGIIYFSNTSSKYTFSRKNARRILLEMKPDGGLYSYDPSTKKVKTLINHSFFGNGVAVALNDEFVLMVDLAKYRVMRYWLKGDKMGETDLFIDNLPGFPNGIATRDDGSFWIGFTTRRSDLLDNIQSQKGVKKIIYAFPFWLQPKQEAFGMIMHLSKDGEILKTYYDTSGDFVSEASSVEENNGFIYIGGDLTNHIGKYKLE